MYILGINPGHDATATLLKDSRIVAAVAEERMTRVKYHFGFPFEAIKECIRLANIAPNEIDAVILSGNRLLEGKSTFSHFLMVKKTGRIDVSNELPFKIIIYRFIFKLLQIFGRKISSKQLFIDALADLNIKSEIFSYDHHLCHASSAYFDFGYNKSLIITADGAGDGLSATISIFDNGNIHRLDKINDMESVGAFYSAITSFLGFKRNRHEGKITGLSAYGTPNLLYEKFKEAIFNSDDKSTIHSKLVQKTNSLRKYMLKYFVFFTGLPGLTNSIFLHYLKKSCKGYKREDIAAAAQKIVEDIFVNYISYYIKKTNLSKIGLAGGIFANVRINQKIMEIPGVSDVFIHPNMGDGGISTGAAYLYYNDFLKKNGTFFAPRKINNVYYGSCYSIKRIEEKLKSNNVKYYEPRNFAAEVAKFVYEGKIVGHFNGKMEYGPRALGSRSILANATDRKINDWLNKRLKRTEFMPFAPVCLEEKAEELFEKFSSGKYPSKFMTITFYVKKEFRDKLSGVTHIDNTARPQTINRSQHKVFYDIVKEYYKLSGLPALINTSFNVHEEPIVRTPEEAINSLKMNCIDVLAIGTFIAKV